MYTGVIILWTKNGLLANFLSFLLGLVYKDWRVRKWKPWHVGFIVKQLDTGEIVTCQAMAGGVHQVTYDSVQDLGDCRLYRYILQAVPDKVEYYASLITGKSYDKLVYFWTILSVISTKLFGHSFRVTNKMKMCWEVVDGLCRYEGLPLQPLDEPVLINKILNKIEKYQINK